MKFIAGAYSSPLSLEAADDSRDLVRSDLFKKIFPEIEIKADKDSKSNFRVQCRKPTYPGRAPRVEQGGSRFSTSVGGTVAGFHAHIILIDDPLNPYKSLSETELENANRWVDQISTRKTDKDVTPIILIMQRLHQNDPTGHMIENSTFDKVKHISLPGEMVNYEDEVKPAELKQNYSKDGLLDPNRLSWAALDRLYERLGQYGYAGQIGQRPTPPGGGMFQVDGFSVIEKMPAPVNIVQTVRYWDKAGTAKKDNPNAAYTCGVKMVKLKSGKHIVMDVIRGQWSAEKRERIIRQTAEADGTNVKVYVEQEPGSGGKESAEATIRNLVGFSVYRDLPSGDKVYRADPYSVQVNNGNVWLLRGDWNKDFIGEHRYFPFSTNKDQVDAASAGFAKLNGKKQVKIL
jgi:predicted phage terminase large subunit-like protein